MNNRPCNSTAASDEDRRRRFDQLYERTERQLEKVNKARRECTGDEASTAALDRETDLFLDLNRQCMYELQNLAL